LAELDGAVDGQRVVSQGLYQSRVRNFKYGLNVANVTRAYPRDAGNLLTHINMLSVRQICRTLVSAPGAHVVERPLLKIGFQCQRQANTDKCIPSAPGLMVAKYEL